MTPRDNRRAILNVVKQIPKGKVATYGQIARLAGLPRRARLVGQVLSKLNDTTIPWHRVINAKGQISPRRSGYEDYQRILLEEENVEFTEGGMILLERFQWRID